MLEWTVVEKEYRLGAELDHAVLCAISSARDIFRTVDILTSGSPEEEAHLRHAALQVALESVCPVLDPKDDFAEARQRLKGWLDSAQNRAKDRDRLDDVRAGQQLYTSSDQTGQFHPSTWITWLSAHYWDPVSRHRHPHPAANFGASTQAREVVQIWPRVWGLYHSLTQDLRERGYHTLNEFIYHAGGGEPCGFSVRPDEPASQARNDTLILGADVARLLDPRDELLSRVRNLIQDPAEAQSKHARDLATRIMQRLDNRRGAGRRLNDLLNTGTAYFSARYPQLPPVPLQAFVLLLTLSLFMELLGFKNLYSFPITFGGRPRGQYDISACSILTLATVRPVRHQERMALHALAFGLFAQPLLREHSSISRLLDWMSIGAGQAHFLPGPLKIVDDSLKSIGRFVTAGTDRFSTDDSRSIAALISEAQIATYRLRSYVQLLKVIGESTKGRGLKEAVDVQRIQIWPLLKEQFGWAKRGVLAMQNLSPTDRARVETCQIEYAGTAYSQDDTTPDPLQGLSVSFSKIVLAYFLYVALYDALFHGKPPIRLRTRVCQRTGEAGALYLRIENDNPHAVTSTVWRTRRRRPEAGPGPVHVRGGGLAYFLLREYACIVPGVALAVGPLPSRSEVWGARLLLRDVGDVRNDGANRSSR